MGKDTSIEWCDDTFNGWRGCLRRSPGCLNCFAEKLSRRNPAVLGKWGPEGVGTRVVASESMWCEPEKWDRKAAKDGVRRRVFSASLADIFEDWDGQVITSKGNPFWWCHGSLSNSPLPSVGLMDGCRFATLGDIRERLFQTIDDTPNLDWLLVTKRPENILEMWPGGPSKRRENVWLMTSVENQKYADERIPELLRCRDLVPVLGLSLEPLLEVVDLLRVEWPRTDGHRVDVLRGGYWDWRLGFVNHTNMPGTIDWVIVGGESGHEARPFDPAWAMSIRDQCEKGGVPFFMKQMGSNPVGLKLKDSHGGNWDEWPEEFRVREFPR